MEKEKLDGLSYEAATRKLSEKISILEKSDGSLDELMKVYKEAFEYYTYCCEYLSKAGEKIRGMSAELEQISAALEDK